MEIDREDLDWAVGEGILADEQAGRLWEALRTRKAASSVDSSWFDIASVAYYGGALIVVIAMGWFLLRVAESFGYGRLTLLTSLYGAAFLGAGLYLRARRDLQVVGGLCVVLAVAMVPVILYNLERSVGLWAGAYQISVALGLVAEPTSYALLRADLYEHLREPRLLEELGTLVAGGLALRYVRVPILTAPIALALWAMATFTAPDLLFAEPAWEARLWVTVAFGAGMLGIAYRIDRRTDEDYAFWVYLFGLMAFWGGLSLLQSEPEWEYLIYGVLNVGLVLLGVFLERRAFLLFGALGIFQYLGHLAYEVFADSIYFPLVLSALGIGLIYLGVKYQQHRAVLERLFWTRLPPALRRRSPRQR